MSDDKIAESLELTPLVPTKKEIKAVSGSTDYDTAKGNMQNILDVGTDALSELASMAQLSQDPRVYRVLTELISAMTTANKELMEIKMREVEIKKAEQESDKPQNVNNNLFVGSTAELVKLLQKQEE